MRWAALVVVFFIVASVNAQEKTPPRIEIVGEKKAEDAEKARKGSIVLMPSGEWERTADEDGQVYVSRGYKGVVPGVRDDAPSKPKDIQGPTLMWVGFQPFATYSRVFIQVTGDYSFTVTKAAPKVIEVSLPGVRVATPNDRRHLVTREFPTVVDSIFVESNEKGSLVRIILKMPTAYLYRQEGQYLFIDVSL